MFLPGFFCSILSCGDHAETAGDAPTEDRGGRLEGRVSEAEKWDDDRLASDESRRSEEMAELGIDEEVDVETSIKSMFALGERDEMLEVWSEFIKSAKAEDLSEVLQVVRRGAPISVQEQMIFDVIDAAMAVDPALAQKLAMELPEGRMRGAAFDQLLASLDSMMKNLEFIVANQTSPDFGAFQNGGVANLYIHNLALERMINLSESTPDGPFKKFIDDALAVKLVDSSSSLLELEEKLSKHGLNLSDDSERAGDVYRRYFQSRQPDEVKATIEQALASEAGAMVLGGGIGYVLDSDGPKKTADWIQTLPNTVDVSGAIESTVNRWFVADSIAASEYIGAMEPGRRRDLAIRAMVKFLHHENEAEQRARWANEIEDAAMRAEVKLRFGIGD